MTPQNQQDQQLQSVGSGPETVRDQDKVMLILSYLGLLALIPGCWPGLLGGLIVNGLALHRTWKVDGRPRQWMPVVGLACCAVSIVVWVVLFALPR